jgi:hypothetical protein
MKSVGVDASFEDVSEIIIELDSDGDGKIRYSPRKKEEKSLLTLTSFKDFAKGVMRKQNKLDDSRSSSPTLAHSKSSPTPSKASPIPSKSSPSTSLSNSPIGKHNQFISSSPKSDKENGEKAPGSPAKFIRSPSVVQV